MTESKGSEPPPALRWGFLGNANIAIDAILPALPVSGTGRAVAIASRSVKAAGETARKFGMDHVHDSYDALLRAADVDAVYIGLPNSLHAEWTRKALEAGKHVLCEKPITVTAAETEGLGELAESRGLLLQEALMTWSHPRWHRIRDLVRNGRIGQIRAVQGRFEFYSRDAHNIRNQAALGGGALLDLGMYLVSATRFVLGTEPTRTAALLEVDPDFGTDRYVSFLLDFPGAQGSFVCSNQMSYSQRLIFIGTHGHIDVDTPFTPPADQPTEFTLVTTEEPSGPQKSETVVTPPVDQYAAQLTAFAETVAGKRDPAVPFGSSINNMKVLDAIRAAGQSGTWQDIATNPEENKKK